MFLKVGSTYINTNFITSFEFSPAIPPITPDDPRVESGEIVIDPAGAARWTDDLELVRTRPCIIEIKTAEIETLENSDTGTHTVNAMYRERGDRAEAIYAYLKRKEIGL